MINNTGGIYSINKLWNFLIAVLILFLLACIWYLLRPDAPVNISEQNRIEAFNLSAHWTQGDVVALVRHVERCDRSEHHCLDGNTGITSMGKDIAMKLGNSFVAFLPLEHTAIYNSPVKRTNQTAQFMFKDLSTSEEWLHKNCQNKFLEDIVEHKKKGINMILITHSTCINSLHTLNDEKLITIDASSEKSYGITIFLAISTLDNNSYVLGYLYSSDWNKLPKSMLTVAGSTELSNKRLL